MPVPFHRVDEDSRGGRKQARSTKDLLRSRWDAKRLNDGVDAHQRMLDRVLVKRIAIQFLKLGIVQTNRGR